MSGHLTTKDYGEEIDGITHNEVEIVIPTLNEKYSIGELIQDIRRLNLTLPVRISILIVDGGSTDETLQVCRRENAKFIVQSGRGKGIAMRQAVEGSKADILVFMDGDRNVFSVRSGELVKTVAK